MELVISNAVVTSPGLNPAVFTQMFFARTGVVHEEEFEPGCIFSDQMCQVNTNRFNLIAIPTGMIQLTPRLDLENAGQLVSEKIGAIVRALGQIQFVAAGLNFIWFEGESEQDVNRISRRLFYRQGVIPFTDFNEPDARFGGYMSKDYQGMRLKFDIKPVLAQKPPDPAQLHRLSFAFNFHKDIGADNQLESIEQALTLWDEAKRHAETITTRCVRDGV
jgi:hypothetical protein